MTQSTYLYILLVLFLGVASFRWVPKLRTFTEMLGTLAKGPVNLKPSTPLSTSQQWAIAAGADLAAHNCHYLNTLETGLSKTLAAKVLRDWWGITSKDGALQTIHWLQTSGHRVYYDAIAKVMRNTSTGEQRIAIVQLQRAFSDGVLGKDEDATLLGYHHNLQEAQEDGLTLPPSILAWDFGRIINICRWCYDTGFFNEQECWSYIMPAAKALQDTYGSWKELSDGYLAGLVMWTGIGMQAEIHKDNQKALLTEGSSPWLAIAWRTSV